MQTTNRSESSTIAWAKRGQWAALLSFILGVATLFGWLDSRLASELGLLAAALVGGVTNAKAIDGRMNPNIKPIKRDPVGKRLAGSAVVLLLISLAAGCAGMREYTCDDSPGGAPIDYQRNVDGYAAVMVVPCGTDEDAFRIKWPTRAPRIAIRRSDVEPTPAPEEE